MRGCGCFEFVSEYFYRTVNQIIIKNFICLDFMRQLNGCALAENGSAFCRGSAVFKSQRACVGKTYSEFRAFRRKRIGVALYINTIDREAYKRFVLGRAVARKLNSFLFFVSRSVFRR